MDGVPFGWNIGYGFGDNSVATENMLFYEGKAHKLSRESRKDKSVNTAWNVTDRQTLEPVTAKWIEGAETMEYINSNREQSGTRITLVLRPKYAKNLSLQRLVHAVQHYMLYQPFPMLRLRDTGVHNISLVTASHFTRPVAEAPNLIGKYQMMFWIYLLNIAKEIPV